jgi:signal transduction histidine kinase/CheY-like chemotaxis protein
VKAEPSATRERPLRLLLVEDSPADATLVLTQLRRHGYVPECERVENAAAFQEALARGEWDCILSDYELPTFGGLDALRLLQESGIDLPFIVVSGAIGEETAIGAMKAGAHDYVMKNNLARLGSAIERELREAEVRRQRRRAAAAVEEDAKVAAALSQVGRELLMCLDSPSLMDSLGRITAEVLRCDTSYTLFWQPDEQVFRPIAGYGGTREEQEIARVVALPRSTMQGLLSLLERDDFAEVHATNEGIPTTPQQRGATQLCIALRRGQDIIGVQTAGRRGYRESFGNGEQRIARGIAQLASLILEHARVRDELERSNRLKSDFVATMSHELRTPLNIIIGYVDLIRQGEFGPVTAEQSDTLQRVEKNADKLLGLVDSTLDLSRLERGEAPLDVSSFRLVDLADEIRAELADECEKSGVPLVFDVPKGLSLYSDVIKIKVIVRNLIDNALKFTANGSVTVSAAPQDNGLAISVTDTGVGISADVLPIIFEPFRQGESSMTRRFGGVGLGLYIVRRLLETLGGSVTVESEVGRGSTFRISVPSLTPPPSTRGLGKNDPREVKGRPGFSSGG